MHPRNCSPSKAMKMLHNLPGALPNNYTFDLRIVIGKDPQCVLNTPFLPVYVLKVTKVSTRPKLMLIE